MPRSVELTVPATRDTEELLDELRELEPLSLRLHEGISVQPPGDVVALDVPNNKLGAVMRVADRYGLGEEDGVSMSTSVPLSVVSRSFTGLAREEGSTSWEEVELAMAQESTMTADKVVVMLLAGLIAGVGIVSGAIHVVVGAMVIAPGFQPFSRMVLGLINRSPTWRGGALDVLRGYGALLAGAAAAAVLSLLLGASALDADSDSYLASSDLVQYWTTLTWPGISVGAAAGVAGGLLLAINRTVLTAGVMVALALIPSVALVPMALLAGDPGLAAQAAVRFAAEVALVLIGTSAVFALKLRFDLRRSVG